MGDDGESELLPKKAKKRTLPSWMKSQKNDEGTVSKSCVDRFSESIPFLKYTGKLYYSYHKHDCSYLCEEIGNELLSEDGGQTAVGFDIEWPVAYQSKETKTALIQLCTSTDQCYLFHVSAMGVFPKALKNLLMNHKLIKTGVGIESDFWKLGRDFDLTAEEIIRESVVDSGKLANKVTGSRELWSLDNLCQYLLKTRLCKDNGVRTSDWSNYPLTDDQKLYAATDAYASLLIYKELRKRENENAKK